MKFKLITWNINSVRLRMPLVRQMMDEYNPDILCLQETKCADGQFPEKPLRELGFSHIAFNGQKGYHGVATLSKLPLKILEKRDFNDSGDARHLSVEVSFPEGKKNPSSAAPIILHNFYVPAGGDEPDPKVNIKFQQKLTYLQELESWLKPLRGKKHARMIMVGDLNIAPLESDVWSHKQLLKVVSHTPIEVEHLNKVQQAHNWVDIMRAHIPPEEKLYTWWSYRARDWRSSNKGRRLDHVWATPELAPHAVKLAVLDDARGWEKPSDHAPVLTHFDLTK